MDEPQALFDQAVTAARQKDFVTARALLKQLVKQDPNHLNAWLLAGMVVETPAEAVRCYQRALQIDPANTHAKQRLIQLQSQLAAPAAPAPMVTPPAAQPAINTPQVRTQPATLEHSPQARQNSGNCLIIAAGAVFVMLLLGLCGFIIYSASQSPLIIGEPTPTNQELFGVLYRNARAANSENVKNYMATIHPSSPGYSQTETLLGQMFEQYDLDFRFYDLEVISVSSREAKLHFKLSTRKRAGPSFRNNVVTGTITLLKDEGTWKIYNQNVEDVQYSP